jgi:hypothetical protein
MNEIETVLHTRLHSLAEDLTGTTTAFSHAAYADSARARFRRRRRTRTGLAVAAAAVVAAVVGVPVIGDPSSSPDPGRGAAHPAPTTSAPPSDTGSEDISQQRAERAATAARLQSLADELRAALQSRATPLSLEGPATAGSCPERAPTVNSDFGAALAEHSSGAAAGDCVWRTPDGDLQVALGFMAGGTIDQIHSDVDAETARAGCLTTALPASVTFAAVALCPEDGATGWHFRIMDTTGTGFWVLSVTVGDERPQDPAATVVAVLEAADADL